MYNIVLYYKTLALPMAFFSTYSRTTNEKIGFRKIIIVIILDGLIATPYQFFDFLPLYLEIRVFFPKSRALPPFGSSGVPARTLFAFPGRFDGPRSPRFFRFDRFRPEISCKPPAADDADEAVFFSTSRL